jgi:hypothetical protein
LTTETAGDQLLAVLAIDRLERASDGPTSSCLDDWQPEYGGDLERWSTDMKTGVEKVAPIADRALIFTTDATSFHGHPDTKMLRVCDWAKRRLGVSDQAASRVLGFSDRLRRQGAGKGPKE